MALRHHAPAQISLCGALGGKRSVKRAAKTQAENPGDSPESGFELPLKSLRLLRKSHIRLLQRPSRREQTCFLFHYPKYSRNNPRKPHFFLAGAVLLQVLEVPLLTPPVPSAPGSTTGPRSPAYPTPRGGTELLYCASFPTSAPSSFINIVSSSSIFLLRFFIKKTL